MFAASHTYERVETEEAGGVLGYGFNQMVERVTQQDD